MDDSLPNSSFQPEPAAFPEPDPRELAARRVREKSLRRLQRLLIFGCALFTLTVWAFIRLEMPGDSSC